MAKKIKKIKKNKENGEFKEKLTKNNKSKDKTKSKKEKKDKKNRVSFFRRIIDFVKELKSEMKKIVWPTKKSVFSATMVVIVAVAIMSLFVVFADLLFQSILKILFRNL